MAAPGRKALSRSGRLRSAKRCLSRFSGRNGVRRYKRRFGVSDVCAVVELRMLGFDIPDARLEQARRDEASRAAHRAKKRRRRALPVEVLESDDELAFIAGYTEGGAPYGVTWDELASNADRAPAAGARGWIASRFEDDDDLPF